MNHELALPSNVLSLSDAAAERVRGLLRVASSPVTGLRVSVEKGGCAGMSYKMDLAEPRPATKSSSRRARASSSTPRRCCICSARAWT